MKFEVTDKHEQSEGIVFKKPMYYCDIRVELSDEEFETLKDLSDDKNWRHYPIGELVVDGKTSVDVTISVFYSYVKKTKGVWELSGRAVSPELRDLKVRSIKELATKAKEIIHIRLSALNQSDEDTVEEL